MRRVKFDNDLYSLPEKWSELSSDEVILLAKLYLQNNEFTKLKIKYCLSLLGLKLKFSNPVTVQSEQLYYVKHSRTRVYLLSIEQIHALIASIDWLFISQNNDNARTVSINPKLVANPVKDIRIRFKTYRGPDDALGNITYNEFMHAETFLYRYDTTHDEQWLAKFMATLWRPLNKGTVEPFNQDKIEKRSKAFLKVKPHILLAIRWYYAGCKLFLSKQFPLTFTSSSGNEKQKDPFKGYLELSNTLVNSDATKIEQILNSNIYFALRSLEAMIKAAEKNRK